MFFSISKSMFLTTMKLTVMTITVERRSTTARTMTAAVISAVRTSRSQLIRRRRPTAAPDLTEQRANFLRNDDVTIDR